MFTKQHRTISKSEIERQNYAISIFRLRSVSFFPTEIGGAKILLPQNMKLSYFLFHMKGREIHHCKLFPLLVTHLSSGFFFGVCLGNPRLDEAELLEGGEDKAGGWGAAAAKQDPRPQKDTAGLTNFFRLARDFLLESPPSTISTKKKIQHKSHSLLLFLRSGITALVPQNNSWLPLSTNRNTRLIRTKKKKT